MKQMDLVIDKIISADVIHHYDNHIMITSRGNVITVDCAGEVKSVRLPLSLWKQIPSFFRLPRRVMRTDKSVVLPVYVEGKLKNLIGIYQKNLYKIDWPSMTFRQTGVFQQGRVPMHQSVCQTEKGNFFLGEYSPNKKNTSVPIWKSDDNGASWKIVFEFPRDKARHIHGCFWDPFEQKVWACTGDFKGECNIVCADEDFSNVEWLGNGDQKWRTCHPIFREKYVYWGMDSPLTQSYICRLDRETRELECLTPVPGPVWYAKSLRDEWMLFACSVEKGSSIKDNYARIFITKDGIDVHNVFQAEKDVWPYLFKMGVISFASGEQDTSRFLFSSEALKGIDGKVCQCHLNV
jgi:hypothetical protein